MVDLSHKVALVTGSSSGIGEAIVGALARRGAAVVVNSTSSVAAGERVASDLPDAIYVRADIADPDDADRLVATAVERYGRLDIPVNNAGTTETIPYHDLDAATFEVWERIMRNQRARHLERDPRRGARRQTPHINGNEVTIGPHHTDPTG